MPRTARKQSQTGIFHILLRGDGQQKIFREDEDRLKFLSILREYQPVCRFELYAYCLMDERAHLLLKEGEVVLKGLNKRYFEQKLTQNMRRRILLVGASMGSVSLLSGIFLFAILSPVNVSKGY